MDSGSHPSRKSMTRPSGADFVLCELSLSPTNFGRKTTLTWNFPLIAKSAINRKRPKAATVLFRAAFGRGFPCFFERSCRRVFPCVFGRCCRSFRLGWRALRRIYTSS